MAAARNKGRFYTPAEVSRILAKVIGIDKEDADERQGIFMIDASNDFVKDGNKNCLSERDIKIKVLLKF